MLNESLTNISEDECSLFSQVVIRLKLPTTHFELYSMPFDPVCLQTEFALEYKSLFYLDFSYRINHPSKDLALDLNASRIFNSRDSWKKLPILKVKNSDTESFEEEGLFDTPDKIIEIFDASYPRNSLRLKDKYNENFAFSLEVAILKSWINNSFSLPYFSLLFLNPKNLSFLIASAPRSSLIEFYRKNKLAQVLSWQANQKDSYEYSINLLEESLIKMAEERLEFSYSNGWKYLIGEEPSMADFALYSFLHLISNLEEKEIVLRSKTLLSFMQAMADLPLKGVKYRDKRGYNRQRFSFIEKGNRSSDFEDALIFT